MKKKKARFNSLSTPGVRLDASKYLVELAFYRSNYGVKLQPQFWQRPKYKFKYRREIQAVRKFIKKYGEAAVLSVAISNYIKTWTDYGRVEGLMQRLKERHELKAGPKDVTPVTPLEDKESQDLRGLYGIKTDTKHTKGLFEKLKELKHE